jgi:hypothetical protein
MTTNECESLFSLMEDATDTITADTTRHGRSSSSAKPKVVEPSSTAHVQLRKLFDSMSELERQEALEQWSEWLLDRTGVTRTHAGGSR